MNQPLSLDDCQRQQLSTCMQSCRNIAYPSLGLVEEVGEYIQKLIHMIQWNPDFPSHEKDHILLLLKGIATSAYAIGRMNKSIRHGTYPQPFSFKQPDEGLYDDKMFYLDRIESLQKELGDIHWMVNAAHFYTTHLDGTDPTLPDAEMTAQQMQDQNYTKLAERRLRNTVDAQGDVVRAPID